jgi:ABC-type nitrate/sulfonate/bicarbonate transport system permease component
LLARDARSRDVIVSERESPARPGTISRVPVTGARQPSLARDFYERNERLLLGLTGLAGILAAWEIGAQTRYLNPVIMSSPSAVLRALIEEFRRGQIWAHAAVTIQEYLLGLTLAVTIGIVIGLVSRSFQ